MPLVLCVQPVMSGKGSRCRYGPNAEAERRRIDSELQRPAFPPASLNLGPAFPPEIGAEVGGELLVLWSAMLSFSSLLGLWYENIP
jgi:hypothetical protein